MAVRIKIPRTKMIEALNEVLKNNEKAVKEKEAADKQYDKDTAKYASDIVALIKKGSLKIDTVRKFYRSISISIDTDNVEGVILPEEPQREHVSVLCSSEVKEIKNAIRLLELSDEEYINTSTYKDVAKYL